MSKFPLTLTPEQVGAVQRLAAEPTRASINVSGVGVGKTLIAVELAKAINAQTILIVAPVNTETGWRVHFEGQGVALPFQRVDSSKNGKLAYGEMMWEKPGVYFIGAEMFARMGSKSYTDRSGKKRRRTLGVWEHISVDLALTDECFEAGVMVSTPTGQRCIEELNVGDEVYGFDHASGTMVLTKVSATMARTTDTVMGNGATPNHPYYVEGVGYLPVADLIEGDVVYGAGDDQVVRVVWGGVHPQDQEGALLLAPARNESGRHEAGDEEETQRYFECHVGRAGEEGGSIQSNATTSSLRPEISGGSTQADDREEPRIRPICSREDTADAHPEWCNLRSPERRQWDRPDESREFVVGGIGVAHQCNSELREGVSGVGLSTTLQDRRREPRPEDRDRMRWDESQVELSQEAGREEGKLPTSEGVDHLEILEPRDRERFERVRSESRRGYSCQVYNIETETSNYFADGILVHNCHRFSKSKTASYFSLDLLQRVGYRHAMSATPTGNSFEGAFTTAKWLWPEHPSVAAGFSFWKGRYCVGVYDHFRWDKLKTTGERNPGEFYSQLPCVIKLESPDIPIVEETVYVELTPKQRKQYTELEKNLMTWLGENPLAIEFPTSLHIRLRQVTLGEIDLTVNDDGTEDVTFATNGKSAKVDAMWGVLEDDFEGEPALIGVGNSKKFVKLLVARLNERWPGCAVEWSGDVAQKRRDELKSDWIDGKFKYVVAVIESLAEGADLMQTATRNVLWFNKSLSGILNTQFLGRIRRQGGVGAVRSVVLEAVDTKDQESYVSLADAELERRRSLVLKQKEEVV